MCVSRAFVETIIDDVDSFDWSSDALAHFNQVRVNISMIANKSIVRISSGRNGEKTVKI